MHPKQTAILPESAAHLPSARPPRGPRSLSLAAWILGAAFPGLPIAKPYVVHEWGTFTTLAASSGELLEGLYRDETRLPAFVHGLPFFNYGAAGWPSPGRLKGVTVKMETPVLYFYSEPEVSITAKVGFEGGTISQWYPQRFQGEADPAGPVVDLGAAPYQGSITWKAKVLARNAVRPFTTPPSQETREWTSPRQTSANLIQGQDGEIEKFLFYRGLGNFPLAVSLRFNAEGRLVVRNGSGDSIPHVVVYDQIIPPTVGPAAFWWAGGLGPGQEKIVARPALRDHGAASQAMLQLSQAMVKEGLYPDEAQALLNTWYNGYFVETGLKAFWILPRNQVDRLLPLELAPVPDSLERVIIGRSEILTPEFEAALIAEGGSLPSHAKDKYYLAYLNFLGRRQGGQAAGIAGGDRNPGAGRPGRLTLPWEGPVSSPALGAPSAQAGGQPVFRDARGRVLRP